MMEGYKERGAGIVEPAMHKSGRKYRGGIVELILFLLILALAIVGVRYLLVSRAVPQKVVPLEKADTEAVLKSAIPLLVDDFDKGAVSGIFSERINVIGGYQGTWSKRPSYAILTKTSDERRGDKGMGLGIEYNKQAGWCGWYTLLNSADVSLYNTLSFWVKGENGGEKFDIGLADKRMHELVIDALYAGPITSFLPQGVTTEWQEVKVPLSRVSSEIDLSAMGFLVLWFKYEGTGKIYVEDVLFKNDPQVEEMEKYNLPQVALDPRYPRALWVWKVDPISNLRVREELFQLAERTGIKDFYLYFGKCPKDEQERENLAQFLMEAHDKGFKVEALTGNPDWARVKNHHIALSWLEDFLIFNQERPLYQRMDGVSLDIEPYLLHGWTENREVMSEEYLLLLKNCRELIDKYGQKFRLGLAIPLFYPQALERGMMQWVDYVALMAYYDAGHKIIEEVIPHLVMGEELNTEVIVGVETQDLVRMGQGERRSTFHEEGWLAMEEELALCKQTFKDYPAFGGFAVHCYYSYRLLPRERRVPLNEKRDIAYTISIPKLDKEVVIDADLSDWQEIVPYVIYSPENVIYGEGAWEGPKDLTVEAYSQWDEANLYFAFKITDEAIIQEKKAQDMWEGDHIEFWLDMDLEGDYKEAVNSQDDYQFGFSPGNFSALPAEVHLWTPSLGINYQDMVDIASQRTEYGYILEVRLSADLLSMWRRADVGVEPPEKTDEAALTKAKAWFYEGLKLGVMIDGSDCDDITIPQETIISSSRNRAWGNPTTFGILVLE